MVYPATGGDPSNMSIGRSALEQAVHLHSRAVLGFAPPVWHETTIIVTVNIILLCSVGRNAWNHGSRANSDNVLTSTSHDTDLDSLWEITFPLASGTMIPIWQEMATSIESGDSAERPSNSRASEVGHNSETNRKSTAEASQNGHSSLNISAKCHHIPFHGLRVFYLSHCYSIAWDRL